MKPFTVRSYQISTRTSHFRRWYWALVPLLALVAYVTALRIGFLQDDFGLLVQAQAQKLNLQALLPNAPGSTGMYYRPVATLLTWKLGWTLWGFNPLPYHLMGLLVHAASCLTLALWLVQIGSRRVTGWLVGALFAVFPLNVEAVGWLSAQWDVWAVLFWLLSLCSFSLWWLGRRLRFYLLAILFYILGVFSKESLLAFLPMLAVSAWLITPRFDRQAWRRLGLSLLPFCCVLALNVGLRFLTWGNLGGYASASTDYMGFSWDWLLTHLRPLVSPINPTVFGRATEQVTGVLVSAALLFSLIGYGQRCRRLLFVAGAWIFLALLPILNLPVGSEDLENSRVLYLAAAGYCIGIAALLEAALFSVKRQWIARLATGVLLLSSVAVCWAQLRPWHTATVMATDVQSQLNSLIPTKRSSNRQAWYVQNLPYNYRGIYLFQIGLGEARHLSTGERIPWIEEVASADNSSLAHDTRDAFTLRFRYFSSPNRFYVDNITGITGEGPPPTGLELGRSASTWDFRGCSPDVVSSWQVTQAGRSCQPGKGLMLDPTSNDPQMVGPPLSIEPKATEAHFVRLRVSVRYPSGLPPDKYVNEWFWKGPGTDWSGERLKTTQVKADGAPHVYWTFVPVRDAGQILTGLRFDPINAKIAAEIQWIAVDLAW